MKIFLVYLDMGYDGIFLEETIAFTTKEKAEDYIKSRKNSEYSEYKIQEIEIK